MNNCYPFRGPSAVGLIAVIAGAATLLVVLLAGCGGDSAAVTGPGDRPEEIRVTLDGKTSAANIGLGIAEKRGYFVNPGFVFAPINPANPGQAVAFVGGGDDAFGIVHLPQAVLAGARKAPVLVVGSVISEPTTALIWLKRSGIRGIADLDGKSIAVPGIPYQRQFLKVILAHAGLALKDIQLRSIQYHLLRALRSGRVDAIFGAAWNIEGAALKAQGEEPVIRRVEDFGIPAYEDLVVVVNARRAQEEPELVRSFMSALSRGISAARHDPDATAKLILKNPEHDPLIGPRAARASTEATLPLLSEHQAIDFGKARRIIAWMYKEGMIERKPSVQALFTNRYLTP